MDVRRSVSQVRKILFCLLFILTACGLELSSQQLPGQTDDFVNPAPGWNIEVFGSNENVEILMSPQDSGAAFWRESCNSQTDEIRVGKADSGINPQTFVLKLWTIQSHVEKAWIIDHLTLQSRNDGLLWNDMKWVSLPTLSMKKKLQFLKDRTNYSPLKLFRNHIIVDSAIKWDAAQWTSLPIDTNQAKVAGLQKLTEKIFLLAIINYLCSRNR